MIFKDFDRMIRVIFLKETSLKDFDGVFRGNAKSSRSAHTPRAPASSMAPGMS